MEKIINRALPKIDRRYLYLALFSGLFIDMYFFGNHMKLPGQLAVCFIACVGSDILFNYLRHRKWIFPLSGVVTTCGATILMSSPFYWPYVLAGVLAIYSKHFLTMDRKHIFNPATFGVAMMLFFFNGSVQNSITSWSGNFALLIYVACVSILLPASVNRLYLGLSYLITDLILQYFFVSPGMPVSMLIFLSPIFWMYIAFMISDPKTSPDRLRSQIAFGSAVALLESVLRYERILSPQLWSLLLVCLGYSLIRTYLAVDAKKSINSSQLATLVLAIFVISSSSTSYAYFDMNRTADGAQIMNGIPFQDNKNFMNTWQMVTVRYREDSKEIRIVYANPIAWQHMQKGEKGAFPEGSEFGKVAFDTAKDPSFTSSMVPSATRRYQIMVKDHSKYASTGDWGYALFDADGRIFNEDVKVKTASCVACHQMVQKLDYVFSAPMPLVSGANPAVLAAIQSGLSWSQENVDKQDPSVRKHLGGFKTVQLVGGPLRNNYFSGTLDEIIPSLSEQMKKSKMPALFLGDKSNFTLVSPKGEHCMNVLIVFKSQVTRNEDVCK